MALELPTLRIGLAGFSLEQQEQLRQLLARDDAGRLPWELASLADADALLVHGARTQVLADGTLRVAAGVPAGRSVQIVVAETQRPVAFVQPLPRGFAADNACELEAPATVVAVLGRFEQALRPLVAQVSLASQILEHETALGSGAHLVQSTRGTLLAVVDLRGEVGLLPSASPLELDAAIWSALPRPAAVIPDHFLRTTLSQLMWQYALRTTRDVLPARYRSDLLYFRRPPRLPQRLLDDSHLLLMRELAYEPATFAQLQQRTGAVGAQLARGLAALYLVGAITSNPRRAARSLPRRDADGAVTTGAGSVSSGLNGESRAAALRPQRLDLTAPAPISLE